MFALAQGGRDARFWGLERSDPWDSKALGAERWRPRDDVLEQGEGLAAVELIHRLEPQAKFRGWILEGAPGLAAQDAQDGLSLDLSKTLELAAQDIGHLAGVYGALAPGDTLELISHWRC